MKQIRLSFCILLTGLLCALYAMPSSAEGTLRASVSSASGSVGQKVTLTVSVTENPGVAGMILGLSYDTQKIKLVSAAVGVFAGTTLPNPDSNNQRIVVVSPSNFKTTGTVASLTFEILNVATGSVSVSVRNFGVTDENLSSVEFSSSAGKITITTATVSSEPAVSSKPATSSAATPSAASSSQPVVSSKPTASSQPVSSAESSAVSSADASEQNSSVESQAASSAVLSQTVTSQLQSSAVAANADVDPARGKAAPMTAIIVMGVLALAFVGGAVYFGFFNHKITDDASKE